MKANFLITITFFAIILFDNTALSENHSKLRIGAILCLTGLCAEWGEASKNGALLAVENLKSEGFSVEFTVEDSAEEQPRNTISAFRRLRQQGIDIFLGPNWTPAAQALIPLLKRENVFAISPSVGIKEYHRSSNTVFNLWQDDEKSSRMLARYALKAGYKRIAILSSQQPWEEAQGDYFEDEFIKGGGAITKKLEPLPDHQDFRTESLKILQTEPEAIFLSNFGRTGISAKQLHEAGFTGQFLAPIIDNIRLQNAAGALDDCIYADYPPPNPEFKKRYQKRFKIKPLRTAANAYDAIMLMGKAAKESPSLSPADLSETILNFSVFQAEGGRIEFDSEGGVIRMPILRKPGSTEPLE